MTNGSVTRWGTDEVFELAALVGRLRTLLDAAPRRVRQQFVLPPETQANPEAIARLLYDQRRLRGEAFGIDAKLFSEPAWDLLLDVFIAAGEERVVSVSAAAVGACVPPTTALRCVRVLEERGLVTTRPHPTDGRMKIVRLTPASRDMMRHYLELLRGGVATASVGSPTASSAASARASATTARTVGASRMDVSA